MKRHFLVYTVNNTTKLFEMSSKTAGLFAALPLLPSLFFCKVNEKMDKNTNPEIPLCNRKTCIKRHTVFFCE